jgi:hypothetical protein
MAENKIEQVDFWIRYFKEHTNTIGCVELDGLDCREVLALLQELADKKVDKQNKMEAVAQLFGKKLGERFTIAIRGARYGAIFTQAGLDLAGAENPFLDLDVYLLEALLTGEAEIVEDEE